MWPQEKRLAKEEVIKPRYREHDVSALADVVLADLGLTTQICNHFYTTLTRQQQAQRPQQPAPPPEVPSPALPAQVEPLSHIHELRSRWEQRLCTAVGRACDKAGIPLMRTRLHEQLEPVNLRAPWLCECEDLVELLGSTPHPNHSSGESVVGGWGLLKLQLSVPSHAQLQDRYRELSPDERQCGLDDDMRGWFSEERHHIGQRVLASGSVPMLLQFARTGVPLGLRGQVWMAALQLAPTERDRLDFALLQREVVRVQLSTDLALRRDVHAPMNEEPFFIFADLVEEVLLAFCRDPSVLRRTSHLAGLPRMAAKSRAGKTFVFPPSGVVPMRGLSLFAYPLCYLYSDPHQLYLTLRELWVRYWCRLHCVSSQPGTLLPLLHLFQSLILLHAPQLCAHLQLLGLDPTRLAAPWLAFAFAGYLPPDQARAARTAAHVQRRIQRTYSSARTAHMQRTCARAERTQYTQSAHGRGACVRSVSFPNRRCCCGTASSASIRLSPCRSWLSPSSSSMSMRCCRLPTATRRATCCSTRLSSRWRRCCRRSSTNHSG